MASYGNTVLTSAGIDLVKRVIANTATFEITRVATSRDSGLTNATISTIEALTTLSSVQQTGKVTAFDTSNSKQVGLKCEFTNEGLTNQYDICAVGIYAKEAGKSEILFAVAPAKEPETMPAKPTDQSALFTFSLNMYAVVGQASAMTITATTEGVVKSINGTIKPDANGNVTMSYYSQVEVDQKVSSLSSMINSLNSTKTNNTDFDALKNRVAAAESGKADKISVYDKATADSRFVNADGDSMTGNLVLDSTHHLEHLGGVVNFSKAFEQQSSIESLINALVPLTGCSGSFQLTAQDGQLNPGWYNFVWMPHRSGGITGSDNGNYGTMLLVPFGGGSAWIVNYNNGVTSIKALAWDDNLAATTNIANAAKTEADANANSIQTLATQVNQNSSKITGNTTAISSLSSTVSNLRVGDRNLARGVASSKDWYVIQYPSYLTTYSSSLVDYSLDTLKAGDKVTFGITIKNDGVTSGTMSFEQIGNVSKWNRDFSDISPEGNITDLVPNGAEKAFTYTIPITAGMLDGNSTYTINIRIDSIPEGGKLSCRYAFVKKGTVATDWTPAPEDLEDAVNAAKAKADANANSIQALSTQVNQNSSKITDAATAISSLDSKMTRLMPQAAYIPIQIGDKTDLNTMLTCGFYMLQGQTINAPISGWIYVKVLGIPTRLTQFVWQDISPGEQWCRWYDGSKWLPWIHYTKAL